jgi:hypothetical protein
LRRHPAETVSSRTGVPPSRGRPPERQRYSVVMPTRLRPHAGSSRNRGDSAPKPAGFDRISARANQPGSPMRGRSAERGVGTRRPSAAHLRGRDRLGPGPRRRQVRLAGDLPAQRRAVRVRRRRVRRPTARLCPRPAAHHAAHRAQPRQPAWVRRDPAPVGRSNEPLHGSPRTAAWPATRKRDPALSEAMIRWAAINTITRRIARSAPARRQKRYGFTTIS